MDVNETILTEEHFKNPELSKGVDKENSLKTLLVDYIGNKLNPENGDVTLQMVVDVVAEEFPEFVLAVAEENFIRGYEQALTDIEQNEEIVETEQNS